MNDKRKRKQQEEEAKASLRRIENTSEVVGTSAFARAANKATKHFGADDKDSNDKIEVWGTRVARVLAIIFVAYLIYYLLNLGK